MSTPCLTVASKGRVLPRNPSVERTFSLPSNHTTPGSFLLPSYPLATLPGGMLTPTLSCRHADSSLSMSNTWPNKKDNTPHQRDTSPWRETAGTAKSNSVVSMWLSAACGNVLFHAIISLHHFFPALSPPGDVSSRCSPRPLRASLVSSPSTSSFRRALSSPRATLSVSPVVPPVEQAHSHNGQRSNAPGSPQNQQLERDLNLDHISDPQEEDPLDMQEVSKLPVYFLVINIKIKFAIPGCNSLNSLIIIFQYVCRLQMLNSLRSLRNSAAKKRAKVSLSSSDPDSPDSAVRLDLGLDSPSHTSPMLTSSTSESGLFSLSSVANSSFSGIKTR